MVRTIVSVVAFAGAIAGFTGSAFAMCDEMWKPVCGEKDGFKHTYTNACWAKAAGAKHIRPGACKG
jgi:hypothetical protein